MPTSGSPRGPGSELAIANALLAAVRGGGAATWRPRPERRCPEADAPALGAELAAARPSLVLAGVGTADARGAGSRRDRAQSGRGQRRSARSGRPMRTHRASRSGHARRARALPSSGCRPAGCRSLIVRGANPAYSMPQVGSGSPRRCARFRSRWLLELSRRDDRAVRPDPSRPPLARVVGRCGGAAGT